jgi:alpha-glucosidase
MTEPAIRIPEAEPAGDPEASHLKGPAEWWRGASVYQIYPRSFADTDGDGVGDLPGITAHLDHVASLGVDAIWISPFFASPMKDFGYDVSDYRAVDPLFGTLADFDALLARAHALGLKVIIDQVYSHTSDEHGWFKQSRMSRTGPCADWYVWADPKPDGTPPSNWQSVFGGPAWTWDARRQQYYLHNFLKEQPNLNVHNPAVQAALLDVTRFWLDRGVDGLRLDAVNFAMHDPALRDNPPAPADGRRRTRPFDYQREVYNRSHPDLIGFLERIRDVTNEYQGRFTVAEVGGPDPLPEMHRFTAPPSRLNSAYGFEFLYAPALSPGLVRRVSEGWPCRADVGWPSLAFENHDAPRAVSRWAPPGDRAAAARLLLLLLISLRGNIFLYQGEELGLPQAVIPFENLRDPEAIANWPLTLGRDGARTPMPWRSRDRNGGFTTGQPWLPVSPQHLSLAADLQEADPASQLALTRELLALRESLPALRTGSATIITADDRVLALEREGDGRRLLCLFNLAAEPATWTPPAPEAWRTLAAVNGAAAGDAAPWRLPRLSGLILEAPPPG